MEMVVWILPCFQQKSHFKLNHSNYCYVLIISPIHTLERRQRLPTYRHGQAWMKHGFLTIHMHSTVRTQHQVQSGVQYFVRRYFSMQAALRLRSSHRPSDQWLTSVLLLSHSLPLMCIIVLYPFSMTWSLFWIRLSDTHELNEMTQQ